MQEPAMNEISVQELKRMREGNLPFQLIDLREPYEAERCSIGGTLIPMGDILERSNELRRDIPVVMHCKSGNRGAAVVQALSSRYGFTNLVNLKGGIEAWSADVDPAISCE